MSAAMMFSEPIRRPRSRQPTTPLTGPDSIMPTGRSRASSNGKRPPWACMTRRVPAKPACSSQSRSVSRYALTTGPNPALSATVDVRSYSPTTGAISCERVRNAPGASSRTASATAFSASGFAKDHSRHTPIASTPVAMRAETCGPDVVGVVGDELRTARLGALADADDVWARHQRWELVGLDRVALLVLGEPRPTPVAAARCEQCVLEAPVGDQTGLGKRAVNHCVLCDGARVEEEARLPKQCRDVELELFARNRERIHDPSREVRRGREGLGQRDGTVGIENDAVSASPADVDPDQPLGHAVASAAGIGPGGG